VTGTLANLAGASSRARLKRFIVMPHRRSGGDEELVGLHRVVGDGVSDGRGETLPITSAPRGRAGEDLAPS